MSDQDLLLIEKYFAKELDEVELANFQKRLAEDSAFYDIVIAQQNIEGVLSNTDLKAFEQNLLDIENKIYAKEEITYSLSELLKMFKKVSDYEEELVSSATRSADKLRVVNPSYGENYNEEINFLLNINAPENLTISIENSNEDVMGEYIINEGKKELLIRLKDYLPGRYYWKIFGDTVDLFLGSFFIRVDLMPDV